jgi:cell wall-associated NlpC family hydrolase
LRGWRVNRAAVVAAARGWLGTRWQHQGRSREGVDCVGLIVLVRREVFGCSFDVEGYPRIATDETMQETCDQMLVRVAEPEPGDVVVMSWDRQRHIAIVGDYAFGGLSLIHAAILSRKVIETRLDDKNRERIMGAWRMPELVEKN